MSLRLRSLRFRYAGARLDALGGVDLDVAPGEICRILGPHGSGKSTLLHCVAGIAPELRAGEREGSITLAGSDLTRGRLRDRVDRVALVFQDFESQLFSTCVDLEVAFGPENLGLGAPEIRRRMTEVLARAGLEGFEGRAPATLSGGEKQRLAIACALVMRPGLLLLDDPGSDLDPRARAQLRDWVLADGDPRCVLWAEPDLEEVGAGERVVWLEGGRRRADGPAERVLADNAAQHPDAVPDLVRLFGLLGEREVILDPVAAARWLRERGWQAAPGDEGERAGHPPVAVVGAQPMTGAAQASLAVAVGAPGTVGRFAVGEGRSADLAGAARETASAGRSIVTARGLRHAFRWGREVLRGIDLDVAPGDSLAILGPNGSGKTTLVRCLCGLERPSSGEVRIGGVPAASLARAQAAGRIGYVTQNPDHQIFSASVRDELVFGPRHRGVAEALWRERLHAVLAALELEGLEERDPFSLTKGERQRVAVGAILMNDPAVLVLDEPTTGLDAAQQARLMRRLDGLRAEGRALVMVTHSLRLAARHARRVILLRAGRVVAEGAAPEVLSDPECLEAADLRPLPITRAGWWLGVRAVTPEALAVRLHRRGEGAR